MGQGLDSGADQQVAGSTLFLRGALHDAARKGDAVEVEKLLRGGAAAEERDCEGWTPIHVSASTCWQRESECFWAD